MKPNPERETCTESTAKSFTYPAREAVPLYVAFEEKKDQTVPTLTVVFIKGFYTSDMSFLWMRSSRVVRASGCQCQSRNNPGFDRSILRQSGI